MLHTTFYGLDWSRIVPKFYSSKTLKKVFGEPDMLYLSPSLSTKYLRDYVLEIKKKSTLKKKLMFCYKKKLPSFGPKNSTFAYIFVYIMLQINVVIQCFENRKDFIANVLIVQGCSILEYDSKEFCYISLLLEQRDFYFMINFHIPPGFPKEKPQIVLKSVYHMTPQGELYEEVLDDVPYSPRWEMSQMVKTFLLHITDKAVHKFQKNSIKNHRYK